METQWLACHGVSLLPGRSSHQANSAYTFVTTESTVTSIGLSMRRLQAILAMMTLLAVPLAAPYLESYCDRDLCSCCAATTHGRAVECCSSVIGRSCAMSGRGVAQFADIFLAGHQHRAIALSFAEVAVPAPRRAVFLDWVPLPSTGFLPTPFEPPRG